MEGLPEGWKEVPSDAGDGSTVYLNTLTGQKFQDHPLDKHFVKLIELERERGVPQSSLRSDLYVPLSPLSATNSLSTSPSRHLAISLPFGERNYFTRERAKEEANLWGNSNLDQRND